MRTLLLSMVLLSGCAHAPGEWDYGASGPAKWGSLSPAFAACSQGLRQSPVDLSSAQPGRSETLAWDYHPSSTHMVNNGHTVQLDYDPGSTLTLDGKIYRLLQLHFHAPAEHSSGDRKYPLEMHAVHQAQDGSRLVLAVWFDVGASNDALTGWSDLPKQAGEHRSVPGTVDLNKLLPTSRALYRYSGSLTAPPCTEGIEWLVLRAPVELSAEQLKQFTSLYRDNARPLQPLGSRTIDLVNEK